MADSNKARIEAELAGTQQVANEGAKIIGTIKGIGEASTKAGEASAKAGETSTQAWKITKGVLAGIANDAKGAVLAAVQDVKQLDLATAKLGQSAGISGTQLKASFDAIESKTLESSVAMTDFAKSLGRVTYDSKFAVDSIGAFSDEALATGRSLGDYGQLGVVFQQIGVESQDVRKHLGQLTDIAKQVGTIGGPNALKDSIASLGGVLQGVNTQTEEARTRFEALVAVLGKGLKPQQQQQVASQAISFIQQNRRILEANLGRNVVDEHGEVLDPLSTIRDYQKLVTSRFGKGKGQEKIKRNAILEAFGPVFGSSLLNFDSAKAEEVATTANDRGLAAVEAAKFREQKEGKRIAAQLEKDRKARYAGEKLAGIHDTLVDKIGVVPTAVVESGLSAVSLKSLYSLGKSVSGASSVGTAASSGLAAAALPVAALGAVGYLGYKDIQSTAPAYADARAAQAVTQQNADAAGLTVTEYKRGQQRGESFLGLGSDVPTTPIQIDNAEVVAALGALPAAFAKELKANPLTVRPVLDPNAPKAN